MEDLVLWVTENLMGKVSNEVIIFLISMVPILELRGGLLAASPALLNVPILRAIPICIIGNFIPVPFILLFIKAIFNWMKKFEKLGKIAVWFENKAMNKKDRIEKYEFWGLVLFVGIPLPGTGAWTGSLIAALLNIDFKKAIAAVCVGIMLATVIMSCISYGLLGVLFG
ncbi:MAG: small multi-drug export protein [Lachnospiraceae bacterium]|nr:small multi-drug export protein [Lachnospiraceae bacterium]